MKRNRLAKRGYWYPGVDISYVGYESEYVSYKEYYTNRMKMTNLLPLFLKKLDLV